MTQVNGKSDGKGSGSGMAHTPQPFHVTPSFVTFDNPLSLDRKRGAGSSDGNLDRESTASMAVASLSLDGEEDDPYDEEGVHVFQDDDAAEDESGQTPGSSPSTDPTQSAISITGSFIGVLSGL